MVGFFSQTLSFILSTNFIVKIILTFLTLLSLIGFDFYFINIKLWSQDIEIIERERKIHFDCFLIHMIKIFFLIQSVKLIILRELYYFTACVISSSFFIHSLKVRYLSIDDFLNFINCLHLSLKPFFSGFLSSYHSVSIVTEPFLFHLWLVRH